MTYGRIGNLGERRSKYDGVTQGRHLCSTRMHLLHEPIRLVDEFKYDSIVGEIGFLEGEGDSVCEWGLLCGGIGYKSSCNSG